MESDQTSGGLQAALKKHDNLREQHGQSHRKSDGGSTGRIGYLNRLLGRLPGSGGDADVVAFMDELRTGGLDSR